MLAPAAQATPSVSGQRSAGQQFQAKASRIEVRTAPPAQAMPSASATRSGLATSHQPSVSGQRSAVSRHACASASSSGHAIGQCSGLAVGEVSGHRPAAPGEGFTVPPAQAMPPASAQVLHLVKVPATSHQPPATSHRPPASAQARSW